MAVAEGGVLRPPEVKHQSGRKKLLLDAVAEGYSEGQSRQDSESAYVPRPILAERDCGPRLFGDAKRAKEAGSIEVRTESLNAK
jgi:hypothetical protein